MTDITEEHSFIRPFGAQFCPGRARAPRPSLISLSIGAGPSAIACLVAARPGATASASRPMMTKHKGKHA